MPLTNYPNGIVSMGMPVANGMGVGNIYHVVQSAQSYYQDFRRNRRTTYDDGTSNLQTTITTALAATVTERNDYVIVYPDAADYDEGATLTMNKTAVHLLCSAGLGEEVGCSMRGATIDPNAGAHAVTITGRGVEVAGFWIRDYAEKYCITAAGFGGYFHHNDCAITSTTSAAGGIYLANGSSGTKVLKNFVFTNAGGSDTIAFGIKALNTATRVMINGNMVTVSNGNTMTYGITSEAVMGTVNGNILNEVGVGSGHPSAGTFTTGINLSAATYASDNRIGITDTSAAIVGGTAINCVNNICSLNGGTIAQ